MESITKLGWINDYKKVEDSVKEDKSIEQMIQELKKQTHDYHEENELFYAKMDKQLAEVKSLLKYSLTEQEKQRIASMSMGELLVEMKKGLDDVKDIIDKMGRDSDGQ